MNSGSSEMYDDVRIIGQYPILFVTFRALQTVKNWDSGISLWRLVVDLPENLPGPITQPHNLRKRHIPSIHILQQPLLLCPTDDLKILPRVWLYLGNVSILLFHVVYLRMLEIKYRKRILMKVLQAYRQCSNNQPPRL